MTRAKLGVPFISTRTKLETMHKGRVAGAYQIAVFCTLRAVQRLQRLTRSDIDWLEESTAAANWLERWKSSSDSWTQQRRFNCSPESAHVFGSCARVERGVALVSVACQLIEKSRRGGQHETDALLMLPIYNWRATRSIKLEESRSADAPC